MSAKSSRQCPKCKGTELIILPWLGVIYQCKKCGYRGPLTIEKRTRKTKKLKI